MCVCLCARQHRDPNAELSSPVGKPINIFPNDHSAQPQTPKHPKKPLRLLSNVRRDGECIHIKKKKTAVTFVRGVMLVIVQYFIIGLVPYHFKPRYHTPKISLAYRWPSPF